MSEIVEGGCLCGAVAWAAEPPLELMSHCHCSMCRKSHGSAFGTYAGVTKDRFRLLRGQELIARYRSSADGARYFCSRCGSVVPALDAPGHVFIPAANLEGDLGVRPLAHIFVASKAPWFELSDTLPRFAAYPPGWEVPPVEREPEPASEPGWVRGSCLCGDSAYELAHGGWTLMQCHCSRCRKGRSAAFSTQVFAEASRFRWIRGEDKLRAFQPEGARFFLNTFCARCGSIMPYQGGMGRFLVSIGTLDADPGIVARKHIMCEFKAPWFEITDGAEQHVGYPPPG